MKTSFFKLLALVAAVASPFMLAAAECTRKPKTERPPRRVPSLQSLAVRVAARPSISELCTSLVDQEIRNKTVIELVGTEKAHQQNLFDQIMKISRAPNADYWHESNEPKLTWEQKREQMLAAYRQIDPAHVLVCGQTVWQALGCGVTLVRAGVGLYELLMAHPNFEVVGVENGCNDHGVFVAMSRYPCCQRALTPNVCLMLLKKMLQKGDMPMFLRPVRPDALHPRFFELSAEVWNQFVGRATQASGFVEAKEQLSQFLDTAVRKYGQNEGYVAVAYSLGTEFGDRFKKDWHDRMNVLINNSLWEAAFDQYVPVLDDFGAVRVRLTKAFTSGAIGYENENFETMRAIEKFLRRCDVQSLPVDGIVQCMCGWLRLEAFTRTESHPAALMDRCRKISGLLGALGIDGTHIRYGALFSALASFRDGASFSALESFRNGAIENLVWSLENILPEVKYGIMLMLDDVGGGYGLRCVNNDDQTVSASRNIVKYIDTHCQDNTYCFVGAAGCVFKLLNYALARDRKKSMSDQVLVKTIKDALFTSLLQWLNVNGDKILDKCPAAQDALVEIKSLVDLCCMQVLPHHFANIIGRRATQGSVLAAYRAYIDEKVRAYERQHAYRWAPSAVTHAVCSLRARASGLRLPTLAGLAGFVQQHKKRAIIGGSGCAVSCAVGWGLLSGTPWLLPALMKNSVVGGLFGGFCGLTIGMGMVISLRLASELRD